MKPAAVELHATMDLLCDAPTTVLWTPDTASEQAFLPEPTALRDSLLLADRVYIDLRYLRRVQAEGGCFLIRAKAGMGPQVLEAFREDGQRLRSLRHKQLQTLHAKLPERQRVALGVQWQLDGHPLCLRLIFSWNPRTKSCCSFLTNLLPKRYPLEGPCRAYKWRWQKVAMWAMYVLGDLVEALKRGDVVGLYTALEAAITYLACHAQRAHPARDRRTGRSQLGLEPCFEHEDAIECAEAA